ncbi:MAG: hypothetical protein K0U36_02140, partial [Alphaproteobacteria bacterium]|nr:hypothetical protein [Alphaproteobacteria bacterium]
MSHALCSSDLPIDSARDADASWLSIQESPAAIGFATPVLNASQKPSSRLDLNRQLVRNPMSTFFLRYRVDDFVDQTSIDHALLDGDVLVVDRSVPPEKGRLVIFTATDDKALQVSGYDPRKHGQVWGRVTAII